MMGLPVLRQALARHAQRHYGLDFDWEREIVSHPARTRR